MTKMYTSGLSFLAQNLGPLGEAQEWSLKRVILWYFLQDY